MKCRKCRAEIPDESKFCMSCGAQQDVRQNTKARGNGTGSVFKRGKTWTACRVIGYTTEITEVDGQQKKSSTRPPGAREDSNKEGGPGIPAQADNRGRQEVHNLAEYVRCVETNSPGGKIHHGLLRRSGAVFPARLADPV